MDELLATLLQDNAAHAEAFGSRFDDVQEGQQPEAVTICCSDSRVLQDHAWNNDQPGRLFTCANIGNRVLQRTDDGEVISGDVLYPIAHTGTELAIVMGHTGCGAVTAAYDDLTDGLDEPTGIAHCLDVLEARLEPGVKLLSDDLDRTAAINRLVEYNVDRQVAALQESDDVPESVAVVGVVYDFQDVYTDRRGRVHVVNIGGETDPATLRESHPEIEAYVERRFTY